MIKNLQLSGLRATSAPRDLRSRLRPSLAVLAVLLALVCAISAISWRSPAVRPFSLWGRRDVNYFDSVSSSVRSSVSRAQVLLSIPNGSFCNTARMKNNQAIEGTTESQRHSRSRNANGSINSNLLLLSSCVNCTVSRTEKFRVKTR